MAYIISQIKDIVNDAAEDALGVSPAAQALDTSDFVSLGKAIEIANAYEGFYGALINRLVKTVYFVRSYEGDTRSILRDEHEYGAYVQKVYYKMPDAVDNETFNIPSNGNYTQASPYDVNTIVGVTALLYGEQGTWAFEVIRPEEAIKTAFLDETGMLGFINGIYVEIENRVKLAEENLISTAANTAMAVAIKNGKARNLLSEYNANHTGATLTVSQALESADFLKYASKEIARTKANMAKISTVFNVNGYETFTSESNLVVEMLAEFAKATDMYLQADTFHDELVALPNYEEVPFWQASGGSFAFDICSAINITNDSLALDEEDEETTINQGGIICFMHDIENVACYFGRRTTWELWNPRSEVMVHGTKARTGYAVDKNANGVVFYIAADE